MQYNIYGKKNEQKLERQENKMELNLRYNTSAPSDEIYIAHSYYRVWGFMVTELGLRGAELMTYALIYTAACALQAPAADIMCCCVTVWEPDRVL